MSHELVVVVSGGELPPSATPEDVPRGAPVITANGGLAHARALGLEVTTVIGDLDSVDAETVAAASTAGAEILRHPVEKDATDLELALDVALELRPARILVLAGGGGRLDHLLGGLLLLGATRYAEVQLDAVVGTAQVHVVRRERVLAGDPGQLVSLLALHGAAEGVTTDGLRYPLANETLEPGSTRGISNVFAAREARVHVARGVLAAVIPGDQESAA
jgi:thiamine pyrophosphokinase